MNVPALRRFLLAGVALVEFVLLTAFFSSGSQGLTVAEAAGWAAVATLVTTVLYAILGRLFLGAQRAEPGTAGEGCLCQVKCTRLKDERSRRNQKGHLAFYDDQVAFTPGSQAEAPLAIAHSDISAWRPGFNGALLIRLVITTRDGDETRFAFAFTNADSVRPGLDSLPRAARVAGS